MKNLIIAILSSALLAGLAHAQSWSPTEAQEKALRDHVTSYFAALDREKYSDAYGMLAPSMKAQATLSQFRSLRANSIESGGRVTSRKWVEVNWYPGRGKAGTGVAVAVDYLAETDKDVTICGYLAWFEMAEGKYTLVRDDSSSFPHDLIESGLDGMSEQQRRQLLSPPACRSLFDRS